MAKYYENIYVYTYLLFQGHYHWPNKDIGLPRDINYHVKSLIEKISYKQRLIIIFIVFNKAPLCYDFGKIKIC